MRNGITHLYGCRLTISFKQTPIACTKYMLLMYNTMKICIIGGGISGLCILNRIKDHKKVSKLVLYEKNSDIGGVWTKNKYENLRAQLHNSQYRYAEKAWGAHQDRPTCRAIVQYLHDYVDENKLSSYIRLNSPVKCYDGGKKLTVVVGGQRENFDYVIHTSHCTTPNIPMEFLEKGKKIYHSSEMTSAVLDDVVGDNPVVIGGSKSAYEMVHSLASRGQRVPWVARKIYSLAPYTPNTTLNMWHVAKSGIQLLFGFGRYTGDQCYNDQVFTLNPVDPSRKTKSGDMAKKDWYDFCAENSEITEGPIDFSREPLKSATTIISATGYRRGFFEISNDRYVKINKVMTFILPINANIYAEAIYEQLDGDLTHEQTYHLATKYSEMQGWYILAHTFNFEYSIASVYNFITTCGFIVKMLIIFYLFIILVWLFV